MRSFNIVGTILERDWTDSDVCYQSSHSSTRANVTPNYGGTYEYALDDRPASSPFTRRSPLPTIVLKMQANHPPPHARNTNICTIPGIEDGTSLEKRKLASYRPSPTSDRYHLAPDFTTQPYQRCLTNRKLQVSLPLHRVPLFFTFFLHSPHSLESTSL